MILLLLLYTLLLSIQRGSCVCYFPVELQGEFATQSAITAEGLHKYAKVTILPDAIPVWGVCQKKVDDNVVLYDRTGGEDCMRCFHMSLRSANVIELHTEGVDRCYTNVEDALTSCPTLLDITSRRARQIMLYKSRSFTRDGAIEKLFCPISGQYHFTYNVNDGTENANECPQSTSSLSNCPNSSALQISFQRCTFKDVEMNFNCLGNWKGHDGQNYLALWDSAREKEDKPRYRCAMYDIDGVTGLVHLSFSADATCINGLHSPWEGTETMVLTPLRAPTPPAEVKTHACTFPEWTRGKWQHLEILTTDIILKDTFKDKIYQMECQSQHAPHGERYALFSRDQCGREEFTCIWIKKRDLNVIEFQMSSSPSDHYNATQVCSDDVFVGQAWRTEGRTRNQLIPSCPIQGEHTGVIPDAPDLCARLVSDCHSPQRMLYTVASCANTSEIYEDREYLCLGRWSEGGVTYTYTHRLDVNTYECFAGVVLNSRELFIIEAGTSCQRGLQPLAHGMKLVQQANCDDVKPHDAIDHIKVSGEETAVTTTVPPWWRTSSRNNWVKRKQPTIKPFWIDTSHTSGAIPCRSSTVYVAAMALVCFVIRWPWYH